VSETIGARAVTAVEARILKETRGAPLLTMERTAYDKHGRGVEHASTCTAHPSARLKSLGQTTDSSISARQHVPAAVIERLRADPPRRARTGVAAHQPVIER
jgi:hypothetical protein